MKNDAEAKPDTPKPVVVTVATTAVAANSLVFISTQSPGTVANLGSHYISTKTAGASFVITSSNLLDNSVVDWWIVN